jgi:hypothetical protein
MLQKRVCIVCRSRYIESDRLTDIILWPPGRETMYIPIFPNICDSRSVALTSSLFHSLTSNIVDLLQTLDDCGSPPLATRAPTLSRPTSLRTSDRKSMMKYLGLPLDVFGKVRLLPPSFSTSFMTRLGSSQDAFFQPYLPLQQLDMIKETKSWLCGTTNTIVSQQKVVDLLINVRVLSSSVLL